MYCKVWNSHISLIEFDLTTFFSFLYHDLWEFVLISFPLWFNHRLIIIIDDKLTTVNCSCWWCRENNHYHYNFNVNFVFRWKTPHIDRFLSISCVYVRAFDVEKKMQHITKCKFITTSGKAWVRETNILEFERVTERERETFPLKREREFDLKEFESSSIWIKTRITFLFVYLFVIEMYNIIAHIDKHNSTRQEFLTVSQYYK